MEPDSDTSASLVDIARHRAWQHTGHQFGPQTTVLIGDTPADVAAALGRGARIIGVASGNSSADELAKAGAADMLRDLTGTSALLATMHPSEPAR